MKRLLALSLAVSLMAVCSVAAGVTLTPGKTEVVIAADASKTVRFAAAEMTNFLTRVLRAAVPVREVKAGGESRWTKDGLTSIVLGDNAAARAAGIDVAKLPRDGFVIRTVSQPSQPSPSIFIAGRDDAKSDPAAAVAKGYVHWLQNGERATLFGVYEFLERFAGCRFFFPGECGEVVPRLRFLTVPETDLTVAPVLTARNPYMGGDGAWFADEGLPDKRSRGKALNWLRLRMETEQIPCCHGQNGFMIPERFYETHPEYFQLRKDGTRCPWKPIPGRRGWELRQLCQSSAIWDVFYADAKAYLMGMPAAVRGIPSRWDTKRFEWNANCSNGRYVDVMPQDAFQPCQCSSCQTAYRKAGTHYATELVWGQTAKLARRLQADGVAGAVVQMAYPPYGEVPAFDLPDNIVVMVAQTGPWTIRNAARTDAQIAMFRAWYEKTHRRVLTWTYPHKYGATAILTLPCVAPRAYAAYWRRAAPYVCGGFLESECDRSFYQLFNYYVYSKLAWNPNLNIEALIADHHAKMFGKGAAAMATFYDELEDAWLSVAGDIRDTPTGPVATVPGEYEIMTRIYSSARLAKLGACCDAALRAAAGDGDAQKRIAFVRAQYLTPLEKRVCAYADEISVPRELARRKAHPDETNLIDNGDLSQTNKWGNSANWSTWPQRKNLDAATFRSPPYALYVTHTNRQYASCHFKPGRLQPGKSYRFSYFLKMKDVVKLGGANSGVHMAMLCGGREVRVPGNRNGLSGTMDWTHHSGVFTMPEKPTDEYRDGLLCLRLAGASGTVWLDDVLVTELPTEKLKESKHKEMTK